MSDVKKLLAEATPLPWRSKGSRQPWANDAYMVWAKEATQVVPPALNWKESCANAALIVAAVNALPAYEAAVEALQAIANSDDNDVVEYARFCEQTARAALTAVRGDA